MIACTIHQVWTGYFNDELTFSSLFPNESTCILACIDDTNADNFYQLPLVGYLFRNSHWTCYLIELVESVEGSDTSVNTLIISIADSNRPMSEGKNGEKTSRIIKGSRFPEYFHELVHTVPKFKECNIVIRYMDCPQQNDGHSCGMYTVINAIALAKFGTTDVIDRTRITV